MPLLLLLVVGFLIVSSSKKSASSTTGTVDDTAGTKEFDPLGDLKDQWADDPQSLADDTIGLAKDAENAFETITGAGDDGDG